MKGHANGKARVTTTVELPAEALTVVAAPPAMLSQRNVESVTGIPARIYLEELRSPRFPLPIIRVGKLRLVEREAFLSYLRSLASIPQSTAGADPSGVDAVLAEVGLERAPACRAGREALPGVADRVRVRRST